MAKLRLLTGAQSIFIETVCWMRVTIAWPWGTMCASWKRKANWVHKQAGISGTGSALAMSYKNWGKDVGKPAYGSIAVFSYGGGKGHVGFVVGKQGDNILVLGGNQSDSVKVSSFSTSKPRLLRSLYSRSNRNVN